MIKRIILKPLIALFVLAFLVALFIGFVALCKWQSWLPEFTEPVMKFLSKFGLNFVNNI